jgi:transposase
VLEQIYIKAFWLVRPYFGDIPDSLNTPKIVLTKGPSKDSNGGMIRSGFLDAASRKDLIDLARDGTVEHCLVLDDDTVQTWYRLYEEDGIDGLAGFSGGGSACRLDARQQDKLKTWITAVLPRSTRQIRAWIEREFGIVYEGRSGLIALLHRLGMEHRRPQAGCFKTSGFHQALQQSSEWPVGR